MSEKQGFTFFHEFCFLSYFINLYVLAKFLSVWFIKIAFFLLMQMFIENDQDGQGQKHLKVLQADNIASSTTMCNLQQISGAIDSILAFLDQMFIDFNALIKSGTEIDLRDFKQSEVNFSLEMFQIICITCGRWGYVRVYILVMPVKIGCFT
jgi:hypothetical protein